MSRQVADELAYWKFDGTEDVAAYGTPQEIAATAQRWIDAGADTIVLQPPGDVDIDAFVGVIVRHVRPAITCDT